MAQQIQSTPSEIIKSATLYILQMNSFIPIFVQPAEILDGNEHTQEQINNGVLIYRNSVEAITQQKGEDFCTIIQKNGMQIKVWKEASEVSLQVGTQGGMLIKYVGPDAEDMLKFNYKYEGEVQWRKKQNSSLLSEYRMTMINSKITIG